ncbi:preprotein translocase subunit SecY [Acholeplasma laidlawii]|jgi:preprotein translocase subunit SecY|uniref:Protein translocase subunit SecY n=2 Tax=Acholeplasma laidlawii TaxID=2148 RepID=A9NEF3_ACHLI|nr:preprotein translocase subunit SecY [Acholeplasma laidlawii]ABX80733.1 preprotein translocase, SecY subunit [Acholeplasma laidlawii PG-8A]MBG0762870.1 preprotein translocase subunit SecY [Acholeplasma laidlawii]NWH10707.1 preprotein translocase subunit SecY [Acholeplasma laidlawii]NWH12092.1 preprotein translocase subunit SecY [Acholeplasma laidlawii]NWH12499.1 preprotein translocase subunit SecY [Acholeplasma laidlawii]
MWQRIKNVLANNSVMARVGITLLLIFIFRVASYIPIPLFNIELFRSNQTWSSGFLGILNSYTGQALARFSVLSLGISPYITASIAVQLLQTVVPSMKEWQEQGDTGKVKTQRMTKYLAIVLAFAQSLLLILGTGVRGSQIQVGVDSGFFTYFYMALVVTAGSAFAIWLADLITAKGVGNGSSILIGVGVLTSIPIMITTLSDKYLGTGEWTDILIYVLILLLYVGILLGVVYMNIAKRKIPINYANRQGGKTRTDSNIPLKINSAGVLPVIFASTILSVPLSIVGFLEGSLGAGTQSWINAIFNYQEPLGFIIYLILIIAFSFFYTFMVTNPHKIADNLSKSNAYVPGVRPGDDTKNYIARILFKVTVIGTVYLVVLAALPIITAWVFGFVGAEAASITLGGTGLLIVVGVAADTTQQLEAQANQETYQGLF